MSVYVCLLVCVCVCVCERERERERKRESVCVCARKERSEPDDGSLEREHLGIEVEEASQQQPEVRFVARLSCVCGGEGARARWRVHVVLLVSPVSNTDTHARTEADQHRGRPS